MAIDYEVSDVRQTTALTRGNRFEDVYEVEITMSSGPVFTIQIPHREYSPERVAALASAEVAKHQAVLNL